MRLFYHSIVRWHLPVMVDEGVGSRHCNGKGRAEDEFFKRKGNTGTLHGAASRVLVLTTADLPGLCSSFIILLSQQRLILLVQSPYHILTIHDVPFRSLINPRRHNARCPNTFLTKKYKSNATLSISTKSLAPMLSHNPYSAHEPPSNTHNTRS